MGRVLVHGLFFWCEQIDQQSGKPGGLKLPGHIPVSAAVPAAAAAMSEQHDANRTFGDLEVTLERGGAGPNPDDPALCTVRMLHR
jgi:hypothetical protein